MHSRTENRRLHLGVCTAAAFVGISGSVSAQNEIQETVTVSTGWERSNSHSWTEIKVLREQVFERMDKDGDGVLSDRDQPKHSLGWQFRSALDNLRSEFDDNGDREVTKMELIEAPLAALSYGDSNDVGFLSESESGATRDPSDRR